MPVTRDQPGPYAPASVILSIVERHRNKGLPNPVDADVLGRAGVSDSLINRTLQALQALDLITETGELSQVLEGLRLAPEGEYKQRLTEWLNSSYADALTFVDPATDDETAIRDAFRSYKPVGQQGRMVTLFTGLFAAAGVMPERAKPQVTRKPVVTNAAARLAGHVAKKGKVAPETARETHQHTPSKGNLPPALGGLLASLPSETDGWTQSQRDKFYNAFGVMLDFCFPIVEPTAVASDKENGG